MDESIADIVAQMRGRGEDGRMDMSLWRQYADRIEAAWKREKSEIEADTLEVGGIVEAARHKPVGSAAAMREALVFCSRIIGENGIRGNVFLGDIQEAHRAITAALSAPPRNCDVGTAEEQEKRWHKNCGPGIPNCKHCKVYGQAKENGFVSGRGFLLSCSCKFVWAQMPYDEQEGGAQ